MDKTNKTPAAEWREKGEADPHGNHYDCERAALTLGTMTDDELANEAFLNYDHRPSMREMLEGNAIMPIVYMTAVKERIRWLSRALVKVQTAPPPASTNRLTDWIDADGVDRGDRILDLVVELAPKHEPDEAGGSFNALGFARDIFRAIIAATEAK